MENTEQLPSGAAACLPAWAETVNCAITVCDADCNVIYMNAQAREVNHVTGDPRQLNLRRCHNPRSVAIIDRLLAQGDTNAYTIEKHGRHKMIYQTPWRDAEGRVAGLVEFSMFIPADMPHYVRG